MAGNRIESCASLTVGERIEARIRGTLHAAGVVVEVMPPFELFWAIDRFGQRRIIELSEYDVYRQG